MDGIEYRSPVDDYLFCYMMIARDGRMRLKGRDEGGDVSVVGLRFTRLTLNASSFSNDWMRHPCAMDAVGHRTDVHVRW